MKKLFTYALLIPAMAVSMMACSSSKVSVEQLNGKWTIVEVKGETVPMSETSPFMEFDMAGKRLHGNAGCNVFNSTFELDAKNASALKFSPNAAATMMACPNMDLETKVFQSMSEVQAIKAGKNAQEMLLVDKEGNTLFVLRK